MKILGITGGVGSGKSRVLYDLEQEYHAYILEADKLAHELMEPGQSIYNKIIDVFGSDILDVDGRIDRQKLGAIVFSDSAKLEILNSISHPLVKDEIKKRISDIKNAGNVKLFIIEAALLIEDGYKEICDEIWYIHVPKEERIKRLMLQRGYTEEKCNNIFDSQSDEDFYISNCDYIIENGGTYEETHTQLNVRLKNFV